MDEPKAKELRIDSEDRISTLPKKILHEILCFDLKAAAKTSVLSKAWRYVWCTFPSLGFFEDKTLTLSVLDRILQTYLDQNHPLEELTLFTSEDNVDTDSTALLMNKWVPILVQDMGIETLNLCVMSSMAPPLELPSLIFESSNIKDLTLTRCKFTSTAQVKVDLNRLDTLYLYDVSLPEGILDSILSNCPFLEYVSLSNCKGFTGVKLMGNYKNLTTFSFSGNDDDDDHGVSVSIEIGDHNIRSLERIELERCFFSVNRNESFEFARLKRLRLSKVKLVSSGLFSCNLHSLEEFELDQCSGIEEFKLSSRSMKRLTINTISKPLRVTVDAPSIFGFNYEGILPQSISFTTTSSEDLWKSKINLGTSSDHEPSRCFNELYRLLDALRESEVSLELDQIEIRRLRRQLPIIGDSEPKQHELPVAVEHLTIKRPENNRHPSAVPFLDRLFHMFRPSFFYMYMIFFFTDSDKEYREITEILFKKRETAQGYFWQRDLERVGLQVKYWKQSEWQPVEYTSFTQLSNRGGNGREVEGYRIHLKWRE